MVPSSIIEDIDLMVRMARRDHDGAAVSLRERRSPLAAFVQFVERHGLAVVLLDALQSSPLRERYTAQDLARLDRKREIQAARLQVLLPALDEIAARFVAVGQRFMLLKGPYLAARFYGSVEAREFVDLDLLVPRGDRERACELLAQAGYNQRSRTLLSRRLTCFFVHGLDYAKGNAYVDLHFRLSRHPSLRIDDRQLWTDAKSYRIAGREYCVLSDEYEIVFAVLSLLRDIERGQPKIKNIVDLLRILESVDQHLDWPRFFAARKNEGTLRPTVNLLNLILDVTGAQEFLPKLRATLTRHADCRISTGFGRSEEVFSTSRYGLRNKLWCARVYEASWLKWLLWWSISLPFRTAVHRRVVPSH